ncbi:TonB-dependent receptor [Dysgonomonas termitidis]
MRITSFLLFVCVFQMQAINTYAQSTKISLATEEVSLTEIFKDIERKSEFLFNYKDSDVAGIKAKVNVKGGNINEILGQALKNTNLVYTIDNRHITISRVTKPASDNNAVVNNKIKVTGQVTDEKGEPLTGVSVSVKGQTIGTITDIEGKFSLDVDPGDILSISFLGFIKQEITVTRAINLNIVLKEITQDLQEVVVVAYGVQKKATMTGAIANIKGDELNKSTAANISNTMAGRISGVSMRPGSGKPGEDNPTIYIRGIGSTGNINPLIVIDGVIRDNMNQINMNDIESVSVLKDATAIAPYGLGGANGVILITTKSGKEGKPTLTLDAYYGWQTPTVRPKMLNAADYMTLRNEAYLNDNKGKIPEGGALPFNRDMISNYGKLHAEDPDRYPDSNFYDEMVNLYTPIQSYNLQLNGGNAQTRYYVGLGYFDQQGMYDNIYYKRYSINGKFDIQALQYTKVSLSFNGSVEKRNSDPAPMPVMYMPIRSLYYSNGLWGESGGSSPIGELKSGSYNKINNNTLLLSMSLEQELPFIKGLSAKGVFSYDPNFEYYKNWSKPNYYYLIDTNTNPYTYTKTVNGEEMTSLGHSDNRNEKISAQAHLNYARTFGKHDITALAVLEARDTKYKWISAYRKGYQVDIDELDMGSSDKMDFDNGGSSSHVTQAGLVYRMTYAYDGKYMLEASGRYDGHSYFAPGKRWAFFPAFSAGWRISEESFLKDKSDWLHSLKLRASWGESGNLAGNAFEYLSAYELFGNSYMFGNKIVQGSRMGKEANPDITWEKAKNTNIGIDASLFKGMLTFEANVFHQKRSGMLLSPNINVPVEYGLGLAQENAGVMTNRGFEFQLGGNYSLSNGLNLHLDGNFSYAKNRMDQTYESLDKYNSPYRRRTGRPRNTPFGYIADGLFSTADDKNGDGIIDAADGYNVSQFGAELHPGDVRYKDISGPDGAPDGKIDAWDETVVGYAPYPRITYGFTLAADWKGLDVSLFFQGAAQASMNIQGYQTLPFRLNNTNVSYEYFDNYWTPERQDAKYPRITQAPYKNNTTNSEYDNGFGPYSSSFWMRNTNYLRLKNIVIGYTLPQLLTRKVGINALRVYASGTNLLTFSNLDFIDPEANYQSREEGYPLQKTYTIGLNITF